MLVACVKGYHEEDKGSLNQYKEEAQISVELRDAKRLGEIRRSWQDKMLPSDQTNSLQRSSYLINLANFIIREQNSGWIGKKHRNK